MNNYQDTHDESLYVLSGLYNYINAYFHYFELYYPGHYWSLTVEEHFYLILPWLLVFFPLEGEEL